MVLAAAHLFNAKPPSEQRPQRGHGRVLRGLCHLRAFAPNRCVTALLKKMAREVSYVGFKMQDLMGADSPDSAPLEFGKAGVNLASRSFIDLPQLQFAQYETWRCPINLRDWQCAVCFLATDETQPGSAGTKEWEATDETQMKHRYFEQKEAKETKGLGKTRNLRGTRRFSAFVVRIWESGSRNTEAQGTQRGKRNGLLCASVFQISSTI